MSYLQLNKLTGTVLFCCFIGIITTLIYNSTLVMDTWEHLRATYLVISGNIPYRDFFEHHHPLLWYIFAPIMQVLPQDAVMIFYVARFFALLCSMGALYFIYKIIINFIGGKENFIPFLLIYFTFFPVWYIFSSFKPETPAYLFYFMGIYFCFSYIKTASQKSLFLCGITLVTAFLFIQTMIFNIIFIILSLIAICYKRKRFIKHLTVASIIPVLILISLGIMLNKLNMWQIYFQSNWLYNTKILSKLSLSVWNWSIHILIAFGALYYLIQKDNSIYIKIIGFLLIADIILVFCLNKAFPHYLYLCFIYISIIIGCYLQKAQYRFLKMPFYAFLIGSLFINYLTILIKNNSIIMQEYKTINRSVNNTVLNICPNISIIYGKTFSYYEMMPVVLSSVDICLFNRFPSYNLEEEIIDKQYTYLIYDDGKDYLKSLCQKDRFKISEDTLKHYKRLSKNLWQHK